VTEAQRKRFMGKGTPYTPRPVKIFHSGTKEGR
jgi:hypothetical protein